LEDLESEDLEVDGPNPDGCMYIPDEAKSDEESDDEASQSVEVTPVPVRKKKAQAPAVATTNTLNPNPTRGVSLKASRLLSTITKSSEGDNEPVMPIKLSKKRAKIVEDMNDDEIELAPKKLKGKQIRGSANAESNAELDSPPFKKPKVAEEDIGQDAAPEKSGKKRKEVSMKPLQWFRNR
jgi:hypothetical protein